MSLLRQLSKRLLITFASPKRFLVRGTAQGHRGPARLALTFDDGPHPEHTPQLLDVLFQAELKATFFVVGKDASKHPDLIRRMAEEGHELGNHTWSHSEPSQTSSRQFLDEVHRTDDLIEALTGTTPVAVRPPKGELSWSKLSGLWQLRKTVALWNIDPRDFRMSSHDQMAEWCSEFTPHDGDILLFHDNHPWAITAIQQLAQRGDFNRFDTVTMSEMCGRRPSPQLAQTLSGST